ncbi:hypothetical protein [Planktothrix phage Pra-JY27]|nr:hypothetical protein [Planktothrix phage Pag-Yong1]WEV89216.1 hypothetical protein [Synechococcus phage MinM2]
MSHFYKPLTIEVHEVNRGLNPSRWAWRVVSTRGGRRWPGLPSGTCDSLEEAMEAAAKAARTLIDAGYPNG